MEDNDRKITQYLIPANVATRFEFFPGFGWSEFKVVAFALLIGVGIFFLLGIPKKTVYVNPNTFASYATNNQDKTLTPKSVSVISTAIRIFSIIIPGFGAFFLVKRNPQNGMSLIGLLKSAKAFKKSQHLLLYKYNSATK